MKAASSLRTLRASFQQQCARGPPLSLRWLMVRGVNSLHLVGHFQSFLFGPLGPLVLGGPVMAFSKPLLDVSLMSTGTREWRPRCWCDVMARPGMSTSGLQSAQIQF